MEQNLGDLEEFFDSYAPQQLRLLLLGKPVVKRTGNSPRGPLTIAEVPVRDEYRQVSSTITLVEMIFNSLLSKCIIHVESDN
jgi:hypothetical protein